MHQKSRSVIPDWDFISRLLSGDVSLTSAARVDLGESNRGDELGAASDNMQELEQVQYFPGRTHTAEGGVEAFVQLTSVSE